MIGVYDYTVILTYLSLFSAGTGMVISLDKDGHPFIGIFFLLFCGLCDAFDGKVASTKKTRTVSERKFGIQIDSLSDLIAFGVLPACIGFAFIRRSELLKEVVNLNGGNEWYKVIITFFVFSVLILYILAAMIRLAYFNVSEEERQETEDGARKYYLGLPVTAASLIFPTMALVQYLFQPVFDLSFLYIGAAIFTGVLFLAPFKLKKLGLRGILMLVSIGVVEVFAFIITFIIRAS